MIVIDTNILLAALRRDVDPRHCQGLLRTTITDRAKDLHSKLRADQLHLIGNAFLRSITRGAFGFGDAVFTGVCAVQ